jgi:hypothetical protein
MGLGCASRVGGSWRGIPRRDWSPVALSNEVGVELGHTSGHRLVGSLLEHGSRATKYRLDGLEIKTWE